MAEFLRLAAVDVAGGVVGSSSTASVASSVIASMLTRGKLFGAGLCWPRLNDMACTDSAAGELPRLSSAPFTTAPSAAPARATEWLIVVVVLAEAEVFCVCLHTQSNASPTQCTNCVGVCADQLESFVCYPTVFRVFQYGVV